MKDGHASIRRCLTRNNLPSGRPPTPAPDAVSEVFHIENGELELSIGTAKLPAAKTAGAKRIALLVAAGRQAGGWDPEWTDVGEIRTIAERYGKYDGNSRPRSRRWTTISASAAAASGGKSNSGARAVKPRPRS